jgi:hypothetical protein
MSGLSGVIDLQFAADYQAVGASTTATLAGPDGGKVGDFISGILIVPTSVSPQSVTISDGGGAPISVFAGGANSLSNLVAFLIPLGIRSVVGSWSVTTGSGLSVIATGDFS